MLPDAIISKMNQCVSTVLEMTIANLNTLLSTSFCWY